MVELTVNERIRCKGECIPSFYQICIECDTDLL